MIYIKNLNLYLRQQIAKTNFKHIIYYQVILKFVQTIYQEVRLMHDLIS